MQELHKIYPQTSVQKTALGELSVYYRSISDSLYVSHFIGKGFGILLAVFIAFLGSTHILPNLSLTSPPLTLAIYVLIIVVANAGMWFLSRHAAQFILDKFFLQLDRKGMANEFKKRLVKVAEQYVGKEQPEDVVQLHVNGKFVKGGFPYWKKLCSPVLTLTILRHEKIGDGYKDTGPLHLSFDENRFQLWAGIVNKKKNYS